VTPRTAAVIAAGSQGRVHARGYLDTPEVDLVAVADVNVLAAEELARDLGVPSVYSDYRELLLAERPDLVSICTPPASHLDVVREAVAAGVQAIHCEKPIALSYADALEMDRLTRDAGVQLTFNLQRRFEPVHRFARAQIDAGTIGDVVTIEGYCPNLPDWGTHIFDLIHFYRDDAPASWVIGQIDVSVNRFVYNAFAETSSLTQVKWDDGVSAVVSTGRDPQTPVLNLQNNMGILVQGTEGRIDTRGTSCRVQRFGADEILFPSPFETDASKWDRQVDPAIVAGTAEAIRDLVESLDEGREPVLSSRHGLAASELIFATYESSRSRRRVTLPLDRHDNALLAGMTDGFWEPVGEQRSTY
jgi:UDP-N-acetylglucosamine 3-dehydrogenase